MKMIAIGNNFCERDRETLLLYPAGKALTASVYGKMLGMEVAYLGVLGSDVETEHITDTIKQLELDSSHCQKYKEGEEQPFRLTEEDVSYLKDFDLIYMEHKKELLEQWNDISTEKGDILYDFGDQWTREQIQKAAGKLNFASIKCQTKEETIHICQQLQQCGAKGSIGFYGEQVICFDEHTYMEETMNKAKADDQRGMEQAYVIAAIGALKEQKELSIAMEAGKNFAEQIGREAGYFAHSVPIIKMYGTSLCKDCVHSLEEIKRHQYPVEFRDFNDKLRNLKHFLKIREANRELFKEEIEQGTIGIPLFVLDDGTYTKDEKVAFERIEKQLAK